MHSRPVPAAVVGALLLSLPALVGSASGQALDHLKCYRVRDAAERASYSAATATRDPADFPTEVGCTVRTPASLLCVAARQIVVSPTTAGTVAGQPSQDYLCYKMKCRPNRPTLTLTDQFGSHPLRVTRSNLYCTPACSACNGACTDLQNDAANCGACDNVCAPGVACTAGSCEGTVPTTSSTSTTSVSSTSTSSTSTSTTTTSSSSTTSSTSMTSTSTTVTVTTSTSTTSTTIPPGALCRFISLFHMDTFDGLLFDVVTAGVFSLVESDALSIQVNAGPLVGHPVYIANGVALRYGTTVFIYDATDGIRVFPPGSLPSDVIFTQDDQGAQFLMQDGSSVTIGKNGLDGTGLNVDVRVPGTAMAKVRGLCGNFDSNQSNDDLSPDGQTIPLGPIAIVYPNGTDLALTWVPDSTANLFLNP